MVPVMTAGGVGGVGVGTGGSDFEDGGVGGLGVVIGVVFLFVFSILVRSFGLYTPACT